MQLFIDRPAGLWPAVHDTSFHFIFHVCELLAAFETIFFKSLFDNNNKRTEYEPSQFGSNREHIAAALAPYMCNAAAANSVKQAASDVVVEDK